jgi:hypothetical protein
MIEQLAEEVDMYPSLLALHGITVPRELEGAPGRGRRGRSCAPLGVLGVENR